MGTYVHTINIKSVKRKNGETGRQACKQADKQSETNSETDRKVSCQISIETCRQACKQPEIYCRKTCRQRSCMVGSQRSRQAAVAAYKEAGRQVSSQRQTGSQAGRQMSMPETLTDLETGSRQTGSQIPTLIGKCRSQRPRQIQQLTGIEAGKNLEAQEDRREAYQRPEAKTDRKRCI